jgi:hypothetical protein
MLAKKPRAGFLEWAPVVDLDLSERTSPPFVEEMKNMKGPGGFASSTD